MVAQVGYSVAGRSRGRVTLCAVCTWHVETRSARFLVEPQNKGRRFMSGLASKPVSTIFSSMASKPAVGFLVEPQNWRSVSRLSLKTKVVEDFPVWASKPAATSLVIWASKSPRRFLGLGLKIKQTSVCRLRHKTDGVRSARTHVGI
jgi:hypothetical protein